jgi:hypothetical protein
MLICEQELCTISEFSAPPPPPVLVTEVRAEMLMFGMYKSDRLLEYKVYVSSIVFQSMNAQTVARNYFNSARKTFTTGSWSASSFRPDSFIVKHTPPNTINVSHKPFNKFR